MGELQNGCQEEVCSGVIVMAEWAVQKMWSSRLADCISAAST